MKKSRASSTGARARRRWHRLVRVLAGCAIVLLSALIGWRAYRRAAGEPSRTLADRWDEGHEVVDRKGRPLRDLPSEVGLRGRSLPLTDIGDRLVLATLVSEDRRFYEHSGVDLAAIVRALGQDAAEVRVVSGASTITQQLVKLLDTRGQGRPRTIAAKLRESARAQNLEGVLSKSQILEAYLNRLSYGHGLVGSAVAAQTYFGVRSSELSWAQSAYLAVLPRAPSYLDPYRHPERVALRQQMLLDALREAGMLSEADLGRAKAEAIELRPINPIWHAPHFVEALRSEGRLGERAVTHTTVDLELQQDVEGLVAQGLESLRARGADNAAALVIDNASGEILAYVGNVDLGGDEPTGQIDMARAPRQPGSTLKPFIYALAFARGHSSADMLADVPTRFGEQAGAYAPSNFDGVFRGPVSAREALAGSLNVPAVRLASELPHGLLLDTLRTLGMHSLDRDAEHYGLALALGSGEVSLRELATAYATLARGGKGLELRMVVDDPAQLGTPVDGPERISPAVAALVTDSLSDPLARVRGLGSRGPVDLGFPVAVKTGTSSGYRDSWCVGYTRERTVAVWVGNADGRPTHKLTGGSAAGPLFVDIMHRAMSELRSRGPLWDPGLLEAREVCPLSGKPVGPACPTAVTRYFLPEDPAAASSGVEHCELHHHAQARQAVGAQPPAWRCDPSGPARIVLLPDEFAEWLAQQPLGAPGRDADGLPWLARSAVAGCALEGSTRVRLRVDEPAEGSVLIVSRASHREPQRIDVRASVVGSVDAARAVHEVEFVLDGTAVARSTAPFRASVALERGDHELLVRPADPRLALELGSSRFSVR